LDAVEDERLPFHIIAQDPDGELDLMIIDWGDGSDPIRQPAGNKTYNKTYTKPGTYTITLTVYDDDDNWTVVTSLVVVEEASDRPSDFLDSVIAIALIIFVALLGIIVGHLSGYYRIGREEEGRTEAEEPEPEPEPEVEEEPEQTAEEIISELEEDLADDKDREYFDHEPTVAELEEMIPRDEED
jgi:PKD repeat protein